MLAAAAICLPAASRAANPDTITLPGHVASFVAASQAVGAAADDQVVTLVVHMAFRDLATLKSVADEVSRPNSAMYGHYLSNAEVAERFAPAQADVDAVVSGLQSVGMTVTAVGGMGAFVEAQATVAQLRSTFGISQNLYAVHGQTMRANAQGPTIPASFAGKIAWIEGLDDTPYMKVPNHRSAMTEEGASYAIRAVSPSTVTEAATSAPPPVSVPPVSANLPSAYCATYYNDTQATLSTAPSPYPQTISWLLCGYSPQQIRAAYGLDRVGYLDGTGVTVAITDAYASPTLRADLTRYSANHGLPAITDANFTQIIPLGIYNVSSGEPGGPYGWFGEQSLDVAAVHTTAPGANIVYIGSRDNGPSLDEALINAIVNHQADVITNSWSNNSESVLQASINTEDQAFMVAAATGVTVLFSSGDSGDLSQVNGVASSAWPSSSPYVIQVGGTSLGVLDSSGNKYETGWGNYRANALGVTVNSAKSITTSGVATTTVSGTTYQAYSYYAGSGGGLSIVEPQPSYQAGVVPSYLATELNLAAGSYVPVTPRRVGPDISMVADPYTGFLYGETFTIAGDPVADSGCTPTGATTEYCEDTIGGTSLSSPLLAGVIAVANNARLKAGGPMVGFANPLLYTLKVGQNSLTETGVNQILPAVQPTAVLRGYANNLNRLRIITINSVPPLEVPTPFDLQVCNTTPVCEGLNDVFNYTTPGFNTVTGLGVPWVPNLVK